MVHEPPVWTYWEGPRSAYIELCLESIGRYCNVRVLDPASFDELWRDDRDIDKDRLYVAHRADFIRVYLLYKYGGAWIDADCIVLKSIAELAAHLDTHDLVYYRQPDGAIANNFLIARANAEVMASYYSSVVSHLRQRKPISWLEIGSVPLTAAIARHPHATKELSSHTIMPISWSESRRFLEPVPQQALEEAVHGNGSLHDPRAFCYMTSNHSMPEEVKTMTKQEILASPTFLNYLFRLALAGEPMEKVAPNYDYWRQSGDLWACEYERRKARHPYYHIQEMMIVDHVAHHAPCRVLEFGCGTGRHLRNLMKIANADVHGFDQSEGMVEAGFEWASPDWRRSRLQVGVPGEPLPYADGTFDIVFSCEALLHTRPDDLGNCLRELVRVSRGHILHLESPPSWTGYSPSCNGCWGHDLVKAYASLGYDCELLNPGFTRQVPYLVKVKAASVRWTWSAAMLVIYQQLDAQLEEGFAQAGVPAMA